MEACNNSYARACVFAAIVFTVMFSFMAMCFAEGVEALPLNNPEQTSTLPLSSAKVMIDDKNLSMILEYKDALPPPGTIVGNKNESGTLDHITIFLDIDNNPDTPGTFDGFEREVQVSKNAGMHFHDGIYEQPVYYSVDVKEWGMNKLGEDLFRASDSENPENISIDGKAMTIHIPVQYVGLKNGAEVRIGFMGSDYKKVINKVVIP